MAVMLDELLFAPPLDELKMWVIEFATLELGDVPLTTTLDFIDRFWGMLPRVVQNTLRRERRQVKATASAGRLFRARTQRDYSTVRAAAWRTVIWQPTWLQNRGFVISWIKSWLPNSLRLS